MEGVYLCPPAKARRLHPGDFTQGDFTHADDHMPFVELGVNAVDVIDFDYAPWPTDADTIDKLSAQSLEIVGRVMEESIRRLERQ